MSELACSFWLLSLRGGIGHRLATCQNHTRCPVNEKLACNLLVSQQDGAYCLCSLPSFLKRQMESLCTGVHFSKAAVSHCPSSRERQRPRTQLVLQVKPLAELLAVLRACSPPTAPSSRALRNFALLGTRPPNHIQQQMRGGNRTHQRPSCPESLHSRA